MSAPNAELAYRVLDHIDAHPEQWDQKAWFRQTACGTAGCFAGWTVLLAGHRIDVDPEPDRNGDRYYAAIDGDRDLSISEAAKHDFGIAGLRVPCKLCDGCQVTSGAAATLFEAANTREDLGRLVAEIFGPRPEPLGAGNVCAEPSHHHGSLGQAIVCGIAFKPRKDVPPNTGSVA